jgi:UDP-N-acetylglucosamine 2-epimerase
MKKLKLMTFVGTRPEIIRLSEIIKKCDQCFEHVFVHTGQNYDYHLSEIFFTDLELRPPDYYLGVAGENLGKTIGNIIDKSYSLMLEKKPDALLILGDTNSCLCAIPAKRLKIPIFHLEAGNRCYDQNVPEEINRKIVDHISDINMAYTEHSRRYLISEGLRKDHIFVTGSPLREVVEHNMKKIKQSDALSKYNLVPGNYFIVSLHREENIDNEKTFYTLMSAINEIAERYELPILFSTHPRCRLQINNRGFIFHQLVRNVDPLGFIDYLCLQKNSYCVLSDSGTLSEERAMLGFSGVLLRTSTERPEVLDKGLMVIGGINAGDICQAVEMVKSVSQSENTVAEVLDYSDQNVSGKVVSIIQSYTKIVNKVIWGKE